VALGIFGLLAFFFIRRGRAAKDVNPPQYSDTQPITEFYDYKSTAKLEQEKNNFHEMDTWKVGNTAPVELPMSAAEEAAAKERARIARMEDRVAAGYDGAYRGN
jgi:hypothetical protein